MKKNTKILLCLSALFIALGALFMVGSLAFGVDPMCAFQSGMLDFKVQQKRTSEFSADGQYALSEDGIDELSIDWLDGSIEIEGYDGSEIILQESNTSGLNEDNSLMYTIDNNTLNIVSAPSQAGLFLSNTGREAKNLHIYLPKNNEWKDIKIDAQDADISINGMIAAAVKADVVDGDLSLSKVDLGHLTFGSMEGSLTAKASRIEQINADTTSGGITASLINCPSSIQFDTMSGDTELYLPNDSQFVVQMDTFSGTLDTDFVGTYNEDCFTVGNGNSQFKISTTNGSTAIHKITN